MVENYTPNCEDLSELVARARDSVSIEECADIKNSIKFMSKKLAIEIIELSKLKRDLQAAAEIAKESELARLRMQKIAMKDELRFRKERELGLINRIDRLNESVKALDNLLKDEREKLDKLAKENGKLKDCLKSYQETPDRSGRQTKKSRYRAWSVIKTDAVTIQLVAEQAQGGRGSGEL